LQIEENIFEMEKWRIAFFNDRPEAETYSLEYRPYADIRVRSEKDGTLPVRNEPNNQSETVYKLTLHEEAKVLEKATGEVSLSGLSGTWYKILTREGVTGYCFDYYLTVIDPDAALIDQDDGRMDEDLAYFFDHVWRPLRFAEMVDAERIDLTRFNSSYGLFPDLEEKRIVLRTPYYTLNFDYDSIKKLSPNRYSVEGTSLQLTFRGSEEKEVVVQYSYQKDVHRYVYILLDRDIDEIIQEELDRRQSLYSTLIARSNTLHSEAFGTITMTPNRTFTWEGFERLIPQVISPEAQPNGTVHMQVFIGLRLSEVYDGAVSFHFAGTPPEYYVHFIFDITASGVKFVYVPDKDVNKNLILKESLSPLTIFFSYR
ncbi:MAG: SH3 domain-containing protein, partial [Spirochaetia bacterium]